MVLISVSDCCCFDGLLLICEYLAELSVGSFENYNGFVFAFNVHGIFVNSVKDHAALFHNAHRCVVARLREHIRVRGIPLR